MNHTKKIKHLSNLLLGHFSRLRRLNLGVLNLVALTMTLLSLVSCGGQHEVGENLTDLAESLDIIAADSIASSFVGQDELLVHSLPQMTACLDSDWSPQALLNFYLVYQIMRRPDNREASVDSIPLEEYNKILSEAANMVDTGLVTAHPLLNYYGMQLKTLLLVEDQQYQEARSVLNDICRSKYAEAVDSVNLSIVLSQLDMPKEAFMLFDSISGLSDEMRRIRPYLFNRIGDMSISLGNVDSMAYAGLMGSINNAFDKSVLDILEINRKQKASNQRRVTLILVSFGAVIAILIVTLLIMYIRQCHEINRRVLFAEQLSESLNRSRDENERVADVTKRLLANRYMLFEEFSEIMLCNSDTKVARRKIADTVTRLIGQMSIRSEKIKELENEVNAVHENLFSDFKKDLPTLKEADYRLFLFSVMGLSAPTISLLLKEDKIEAVYNRKRRLKDKIKLLSQERRDRYMQFL